MRSRKASAKTPRAGSPAGIGVSVAVQVSPRSAECSTRARAAPPVASQTSRGPELTRHWPLAAKPASPSCAAGMPGVRQHLPGAAAVAGRQDAELPVHRVAHGEAVAAVEEGEAVVERLGVGVAEGLRPGRSAVVGAVDAGGLALADGQRPRPGARRTPRCPGTASSAAPGGETSRQLAPPSVVRSTVPLGAGDPGGVPADGGEARGTVPSGAPLSLAVPSAAARPLPGPCASCRHGGQALPAPPRRPPPLRSSGSSALVRLSSSRVPHAPHGGRS